MAKKRKKKVQQNNFVFNGFVFWFFMVLFFVGLYMMEQVEHLFTGLLRHFFPSPSLSRARLEPGPHDTLTRIPALLAAMNPLFQSMSRE